MNKILFNILIFTLLSQSLFSQKDHTLVCNVGYGYYETFTLGLKYYLNPEHNIGIAAGSSFMINNEMYYSVMFEDNIALFRSDRDNFNNYKWFLTGKLLYWDMEDKYYRWNVLSLSPALTRRFRINERISLTADLGPLFNIVLESYRKTYEALGWPYHVMPNIRVLVNYRFRTK
jgi:hypothetical protein